MTTLMTFNNIGYLTSQFTDEELKPVRDEADEIMSNFSKAKPHNKYLVGNIEKEYLLEKSVDHVHNLIAPLITQYDSYFNYTNSFEMLSKDVPIGLDKVWINFQKKYEFNPMHSHTGIYSFVIWLEIPYSMEDEMAREAVINAVSPVPGHFAFTYINSMGKIIGEQIPADKTYRNKVLVFPAAMNHTVYPFYTSDKYRISVSGNYHFKCN